MTDKEYWRKEVRWATEQIEFAERQMLFWFRFRRDMSSLSYGECREKFCHYRQMRKRFRTHLIRVTTYYLQGYKS